MTMVNSGLTGLTSKYIHLFTILVSRDYSMSDRNDISLKIVITSFRPKYYHMSNIPLFQMRLEI